jgi:hypothetical protein
MAKSPSKPAAKAPAKTGAAKAGAAAKPKTPAAPKPARKPAVAKATPELTATKAALKPAKAATPKVKSADAGKATAKSMFKETSERISQLASDILADRIVPTIEQIKAIAASALGQDETKGKKAKGKKKKK